MIAMVALILASIFLAPVFLQSSNPCSSCHGGAYSQNFDFFVGNGENQLPATLGVGQTVTVTVVVENNVNTGRYSALSSVTVTLSSQNGHFFVASPTYNIGLLQMGTGTASWQITGESVGSDSLIITASAVNPHENLGFSDTYSPVPSLSVFATGLTPSPTPSPTPVATPTPSPNPTLIQTPPSGSTPTPTQATPLLLFHL